MLYAADPLSGGSVESLTDAPHKDLGGWTVDWQRGLILLLPIVFAFLCPVTKRLLMDPGRPCVIKLRIGTGWRPAS